MTSRASSQTIPGELAMIAAIRRQARNRGVESRGLRVGIGDDCAILRPRPGYEICVTTDFTLEERHFRRAWHPAESVGHRCLARGLSDLAAMGADTLAVFLSLAVPARLPLTWVERFLSGFLALARKVGVPLAGGDTAESPAISKAHNGLIAADLVAIGQVPRGKALLRSGARRGDSIYVTGALGGAAAELAALETSRAKFRELTQAQPGHPHFYPEPRIAAGRRLRGMASAAIDLSDGLSTDLTHLCEESDVAAILEERALPMHPLTVGSENPIDAVLNGGEDYELLFTAPPEARIPRRIAGVPVSRIGMVRERARAGARLTLQTIEGKEVRVAPRGWEHFR